MGEIGEEGEAPIDGHPPGPFVIDASALSYATTESGPGAATLRHVMATQVCHAPHLIDAEFGNVLRRKVLRGELTATHAEVVLHAAPALIDFRHDHAVLAAAAWSLRGNVTFYDGLYVALAAGLGIVLVTHDKRLAAAPGVPCEMWLVE
ncbi:MAG TPA: type II toxin-antitoxin system VapC family toxin [Micromonosporaceae bacterium]